jgi:hypothetical protein
MGGVFPVQELFLKQQCNKIKKVFMPFEKQQKIETAIWPGSGFA